MTRIVGVFAALTLSLAVSTNSQGEEAPKPLRILLTYGGHGFAEAPFFAMFDALPGIQYTKAPLPEKADLLKPGLENEYDAIVMYDMVRKITPQQQAAFVQLLEKGIGLVSLHHNLGAHRDWSEFPRIIGGKFIFGESVFEGKPYKKSTWSHGEDLKVTIADHDHPITKGLSDFQIHDETYGGYYTASDVHILLRTDHPKNDPELAWTKNYGVSRVFYLMLGHDQHAWQNSAYPQLLERGIRWVAGD
jgi:type 1 glutamine amidotransferase